MKEIFDNRWSCWCVIFFLHTCSRLQFKLCFSLFFFPLSCEEWWSLAYISQAAVWHSGLDLYWAFDLNIRSLFPVFKGENTQSYVLKVEKLKLISSKDIFLLPAVVFNVIKGFCVCLRAVRRRFTSVNYKWEWRDGGLSCRKLFNPISWSFSQQHCTCSKHSVVQLQELIV